VDAAKRLERHLEEIATKVTTKETMTHFVNAGMEVVTAANVAVKHLDVPDETKMRIHRAEREVLLAARSFIDAIITEVDKEIPEKNELKRVEVKRKAR
jgi:folate-dependent phosphoribosylglycinamide formyltransferase PurN